MQTGPAKGQSMKSWLRWTGWGELANIFILSLISGTLHLTYPDHIGVLASVGTFSASFLLLQGGVYWLLKRRGFFSRSSRANRSILWLQRLYVFNALMLLVFPVWLIVRVISFPPIQLMDIFIGLLYYVLAVGEYIHYFFFKINMRPDELKRAIRKRKPIPARFRRELARMKQTYHRHAPQHTIEEALVAQGAGENWSRDGL